MRLKRTGIFTKLIIVVLLIYAVTTLIVLRGKIETAQAKKDELIKERADKTAAIDDMQYALDHKDDDEVLEDLARKGGMVYQDEGVVIAG